MPPIHTSQPSGQSHPRSSPLTHPWRISPRRARALQLELAERVRISSSAFAPRLVAGLDATYSADGRHCVAAAVLWDTRTGEVIDQQLARRRLSFPYIPGLLSFREAPALLAALHRLRHGPDCLLCDGHGLAHPRRFGIACHIGVLCDLPSVGCAKSRLIGTHTQPARHRGAWVPLLVNSTTIGIVLRTRTNVRPVYVSVGHLTHLDAARELVLGCATRYRLPEPTRLADRLVGRIQKA